jgi:hypothetical protein
MRARDDLPGDHPVPFEQGPRVPIGVPGLPLLLGVGLLVYNAVDGQPFDGRFWMAWTIVIGGLAAVVAVVILPQSYKRVRVDRSGLHVAGKLALPAARIGRVQPLTGGNAASQSWPLSRNRHLKMPARQNLYGGLYGFGPAVGVEEVDRRGERRSTWLLPTADPDRLVATLEDARDHAATSRS